MNPASSERCAAGPRIACGEPGTLVQAYGLVPGRRSRVPALCGADRSRSALSARPATVR